MTITKIILEIVIDIIAIVIVYQIYKKERDNSK